MPDELRKKFSKSVFIDFDVKAEHQLAMSEHHRPRVVMDRSIQQHVKICMENSESAEEALVLAELLKEEVEYRVRVYSRCLSKTSESYVRWLQDEYKRDLKAKLVMNYLNVHVKNDEPSIADMELEQE